MKERNAAGLLSLASFLWGMTFVFQSQAADLIGPFFYNAVRMFIGAVVLFPLARKSFARHAKDADYRKAVFSGGTVCGFFIAAASAFQQYGIGFTTAGRAGFITSLYCVFVPLFSVVAGRKIRPLLWFCAVLGISGGYLLSTGAGEEGIGTGDILIFCCAVLFSFQIMSTEYFGRKTDGPDLSFVQFLTGSLFSFAGALFSETVSWQPVRAAWVQILYAGIFSCGIAYTLQIVGQKYVQPAKATLVLSLESVWAALGGVVFLREHLTVREIAGCLVLFSAVVISQLKAEKKR